MHKFKNLLQNYFLCSYPAFKNKLLLYEYCYYIFRFACVVNDRGNESYTHPIFNKKFPRLDYSIRGPKVYLFNLENKIS